MIRRRIITIVAVWAILVFLLWVSDSQPAPLAVGGIVAAITALIFVVFDVVSDPVRIDWGGNDRPPPPPASADPRVVDLRRQLEAAWRADSTRVTTTLVELVDDRLSAHHHVDRATDPDAAALLLSPTLRRLTAATRRQAITPRELQRILTDIEAL